MMAVVMVAVIQKNEGMLLDAAECCLCGLEVKVYAVLSVAGCWGAEGVKLLRRLRARMPGCWEQVLDVALTAASQYEHEHEQHAARHALLCLAGEAAGDMPLLPWGFE